MSRIREINIHDALGDAFSSSNPLDTVINVDNENVSAQNPVPVNVDSIYSKDIDIINSDVGGFSGNIIDYFDSLKTVNHDTSATNPKTLKIAFQRSFKTSSIGFGCDNIAKSFSNIKIKILGSGEEIRYTKDLSADNTKYNSLVVDIEPNTINGILIEFHTTDEVSLSNIIIYKTRNTESQISALSNLTNEIEAIQSFKGALDVNTALVHNRAINEYFKRSTGGVTTLTAVVLPGATSIEVADATDFAVGDLCYLASVSFVPYCYFIITNVTGSVLTLNRPVNNARAIGDAVIEIEVSMNVAGSLAAPISYKLQPPAGERWQITRLLLTMLDSSAMDDGLFGGITALTNGAYLRFSINGFMSCITCWRTNGDLKSDMFDVVYADKAPAGQYGLNSRWNIRETESVIDLDSATSDYIEVLIQDDLTNLDDLKLKAQGRIFGA